MNQITRAAIVTGGSRGIGRAIALRLANDGFAVAVNYAGNAALAEDGACDRGSGGRAIAIQADVADETAVAQLFEKAQEAFGPVDVVVNSAGIMQLTPITGESALAAFDKVVATNLRGAFIVMAEAARTLQRGGRLILLSTSVIAKSLPGYGPYIASKAGVEGLVHVLANELRGREITVNAIAPGPVATELFLQGKSEELIAQIAKQAPMERIGQPDDISAAVSFLAGPDGAWVNSQVVRVNGGFA